MKNLKLACIALLALTFAFSSCKKKEKDPEPTSPLASFSFPTTTDLKIEMSWTVNGLTAGNDYVDLDFDIYSGNTGTTYNSIDGSSTGSSFESTTLSSSTSDFTGTLGVNYYGNKAALTGLTSPYTITYTIKVYPTGNVAAAQTYTRTFVNPSTGPDSDILYNQLSVVKTATTYSFNELATKTTFDYSTIP
jgi:hypothetical protein